VELSQKKFFWELEKTFFYFSFFFSFHATETRDNTLAASPRHAATDKSFFAW
jgi:hypothetical protein